MDRNLPDARRNQPWAHLQSMHSQHLRTFANHPAQPQTGLDSPLDRMDSESLDIQQNGQTQTDLVQDFIFNGTVDPNTPRQSSGFDGSFDFSAPVDDLVFPAAWASMPTQPLPGYDTSFTAANPSVDFALDQGNSSEVTRQDVEVASAASAASSSSTNTGPRRHGRRARGEARRGQPRPTGWTEDEVGILVRMYAERDVNEHVSSVTKRIAQALGKSTGAVEAKHWRLRGGDPKASKNRRGGCGNARGGRGGGSGRGGSGGAGAAGLAV